MYTEMAPAPPMDKPFFMGKARKAEHTGHWPPGIEGSRQGQSAAVRERVGKATPVKMNAHN